MLGILYILVCICVGAILCRLFFTQIKNPARICGLPQYMVQFPVWYLTGTLFVTWLVYLISYLFQEAKQPLFYGNLITMIIVVLLVAMLIVRKRKNIKVAKEEFAKSLKKELNDYGMLLFTLLVIAFVSFLMFLTFYVEGKEIHVGYSVFSDFAPHLGMIRSFSKSNNFPTQYAHFAGEDIRYHFMFQFMVGNLEYLGMRLDFAFNLPSILGMVCVYLLLFVLVVRMTKSRLCAFLTTLLFTFRSSFTVFRYMAEQGKGNVLTALKENTEFLGYTQNENWGLWNLNVYCNQRHLAFSLALLLFAILMFYPYVQRMGMKLAKIQWREDLTIFNRYKEQFKTMFFSPTAFGIRDIRFAIGMGLVLGGIAFWNGAVLVATLSMLFFMAAVSDDRLDYLITALIALLLYFLQSSLFVDGSVVSPSYYFGFLAENKTIWGVILFVIELTGCVLIVALIGAMLLRGVKRYMFVVFFVPFILAFTLSLTVDITVNHKWIMMSLMLLSMFASVPLTKLLKSGDWLKRVIAIVLVFVLTATGIYDLTIVMKRNENYLVFSYDDPVTNWVIEHADSDDIFLTPYYSLNNIVMGGAMLYYGWPYYAWSAGYDTSERDFNVRRMYEADSVEELKQWIEEYDIRYIVVDFECRTSSEYVVREDIIEQAYEVVFEHDTGDWQVRIFDTQKYMMQ